MWISSAFWHYKLRPRSFSTGATLLIKFKSKCRTHVGDVRGCYGETEPNKHVREFTLLVRKTVVNGCLEYQTHYLRSMILTISLFIHPEQLSKERNKTTAFKIASFLGLHLIPRVDQPINESLIRAGKHRISIYAAPNRATLKGITSFHKDGASRWCITSPEVNR